MQSLEPLSYFFGAYLGDGHASLSRSVRIIGVGCCDKEIVERCYFDIAYYFCDLRRGRLYDTLMRSGKTYYEVRWHSRDFYDLVKLAVGEKEYLPKYIWSASDEAKLDLLAGLMDTDGTAAKKWGYLKLSGGKPFIPEVILLCESLGIEINNVTSKGYENPNWKPCYDIHFNTRSMVQAGFYFCLQRKQELLNAFKRRNGL